MTNVKTSEIVTTQTAPSVAEFVQPSELCDMQRRSMAYDAFAALQSHGF